MKLKEIAIPISSLHGVGVASTKLFANLAIHTIGDLLSYWPKSFDDRTKYVPLSQFSKEKVNTVAKVISHEWFGFGKTRTLKILIKDLTASAELICFNRPFLEKTYPVNSTIQINGIFSVKYGKLQSANFDAKPCEIEINQENIGKILKNNSILPIYGLTAGLTQNTIRKATKRAIQEYAKGIENEIPKDVIQRNKLLDKIDCIKIMHNPPTLEKAELARTSLIFEELYLFQKAIAMRSIEHRGKLPTEEQLLSSQSIISSKGETENQNIEITKLFEESLSPTQIKLKSRLPFDLTQDQKKVIVQINKDIDLSFKAEAQCYKSTADNFLIPAMARLLQGDVGSGKTLVAFFACIRIKDYGAQCAFLAPTELLSEQHAENAAKLLEPLGIRLAFLSGNVKAKGRNQIINALKNGEIDIVIGTHALFSQNVRYKDLRLAVIDEQHRFGVLQRNAILEKGRKKIDSENQNNITYVIPNLLMMSATPIPQTLALSVFGDLDISTIKTLPQGRLPIKTHLTKQGSESNVYEFVRKELQAGRQAYFVYPLIETGDSISEEYEINAQTKEKDKNKIKSAEEMCIFLKEKVFSEYEISTIHSRVEEKDQKEIMQNFKNGEINILVATSVVEVGVDIPNATCMVIEGAERFGLAALHQLRGRVGRSNLQSHCFLIYAQNLTDSGKARLKALFENTDGFFIAEQDLLLRGPGEVLGVQQSGYLTLSIADPIRDKNIMQIARTEAFNHVKAEMNL